MRGRRFWIGHCHRFRCTYIDAHSTRTKRVPAENNLGINVITNSHVPLLKCMSNTNIYLTVISFRKFLHLRWDCNCIPGRYPGCIEYARPKAFDQKLKLNSSFIYKCKYTLMSINKCIKWTLAPCKDRPRIPRPGPRPFSTASPSIHATKSEFGDIPQLKQPLARYTLYL